MTGLKEEYGLRIGNEELEPLSGDTFESTNPATGELLARVSEAGPRDVDRAVKPAEQTPLSALELARLGAEAGLPEGVFNVITGHGATGEALVRHPGVRKVSFTGSAEVGGKVMMAAAAGCLRRHAHLGEQDPALRDQARFDVRSAQVDPDVAGLTHASPSARSAFWTSASSRPLSPADMMTSPRERAPDCVWRSEARLVHGRMRARIRTSRPPGRRRRDPR